MYRIRLRLPKGRMAQYRHLDLIHDALVNALLAAGANVEELLGMAAQPWNFAALGFYRGHLGQAHSLILSTPSARLAPALRALNPGHCRYARAATDEWFDFTDADRIHEPPPLTSPDCGVGMLLLSPLAIRDQSRDGHAWHTHLARVDLGAVVNQRLSRIAGRPVALSVQPDSLYLRAHPRHSVVVSTKGLPGGRHAYVIGMQAPLVLSGSQEDIQLAWYAGLGEKTRNGFGCIGLAEEGVGR